MNLDNELKIAILKIIAFIIVGFGVFYSYSQLSKIAINSIDEIVKSDPSFFVKGKAIDIKNISVEKLIVIANIEANYNKYKQRVIQEYTLIAISILIILAGVSILILETNKEQPIGNAEWNNFRLTIYFKGVIVVFVGVIIILAILFKNDLSDVINNDNSSCQKINSEISLDKEDLDIIQENNKLLKNIHNRV